MPTDSRALSAAPARAILLWTDDRDLYAEFPGPDGMPVVVRYPLTQAGLSSAIGLIRTRTPDHTQTYDWKTRPAIDIRAPGTPAQRENARAVLRRLRMIG
jgi:hypothetical protein